VSKRVFISYRREDTGPTAGRMYDRLLRILPKADIYYDLGTIKGGDDFKKSILAAIEQTDVALVFIGKNWLSPQPDGGSARVFDEDDYVRIELSAALARPILVLPLLVEGAKMPPPDQLPMDIRALSTRNALPLRLESFDDDTENVVKLILGTSKPEFWEVRDRFFSRVGFSLVGLLVAFLLLAAGALIHSWLFERSLAASIGSTGTTLMIISAVTVGIWTGLRYEAAKRGR